MYLSQNIFYNLQYWLYQKVANTKIARKFRVFYIKSRFSVKHPLRMIGKVIVDSTDSSIIKR